MNPEEVVFEVLADCQMSETEIALSANLSLSQVSRALAGLMLSGRAMCVDDGGVQIWSRA